MLNEEKINNYLKKILEEILKEEINSADLSSISICVRYLLEDQGIGTTSNQWILLHPFLHPKSLKVTHTTFFHNLLTIISKYSSNFREIVDDISKQIISKYPLIDKGFFNFRKTKDLETKNYLIKKCKLVSTDPEIYEIIAREDKNERKNDVLMFSYENLNCFSNYKLKRFMVENDIEQKYYFTKSSERYFNDTLYFESKTLNKIQKMAEKSKKTIIHQMLSSKGFEKILDDFHENLKIEKVWPRDISANRNVIKFVQSIFINDKFNINEIKNCKSEKYYPFLLDPFASSAPIKKIPIVITRKMMGYYGLTQEYIDCKEKDMEVNNSLNESEKLLMLNQNDLEHDCYKDTPKSISVKNKYLSTIENIKMLRIIEGISKKSELLITPAGHGKSHWVINNILNNTNNKIALYTPTNKAQEVYSDFRNRENINIQNIQKISRGNGAFKDDFDVFVFDEISMYDYKEWESIDRLFNKKIYLIGDSMQLQPIGGRNLSKYFNHFSDNCVELNKNWRILNSNIKEKLEELFKDLRKNKLLFSRGKYTDLFYGYAKYSEIFKEINSEKYAGYKILVHKNQGIISVKNINRIIANRNEVSYEVDDEIVFNDSLSDSDKNDKLYVSKKTTIKNIIYMSNHIQYTFKDDNSILTEPGSEPFDISKVMTVHRSQGQSIENVIVIIDSGEINYKWLYTAVSRTKGYLKIFIKKDLIYDQNEEVNEIPKNLNKLLEYWE